MLRKYTLLIALLSVLVVGYAAAQDEPPPVGATATISMATNLRAGPGEDYNVITVLPSGTQVTILNYSWGDWWAQVSTETGWQGWLASNLLVQQADAEPTAAEPPTEEPMAEQADPTAEPTAAPADPSAGPTLPVDPALVPEHPQVEDVMRTPDNPIVAQYSNVPDDVLAHARETFQRGQALGNRANVFLKVGDSNSAFDTFLCNFQWGTYYLGPYEYLQSTIDFFNQGRVFCSMPITALPGHATGTLIDPAFSNPTYCYSGETLLDCELRRYKPSVALIYIGLADMRFSTPEIYETNLNEIVRILLDYGVIPVLSTWSTSNVTAEAHGLGDLPTRMNDIVYRTAAANRVPFIDVRAATASLPNQGCIEEGYHLTFHTEYWMNLNGEEFIYGRNMRELLTLQVLHTLRHMAFY
jgi:hypothetical protein